jgi:hypothetical protein
VSETVILVHAGVLFSRNFVELLEATTVSVDQQGL